MNYIIVFWLRLSFSACFSSHYSINPNPAWEVVRLEFHKTHGYESIRSRELQRSFRNSICVGRKTGNARSHATDEIWVIAYAGVVRVSLRSGIAICHAQLRSIPLCKSCRHTRTKNLCIQGFSAVFSKNVQLNI